MTPNDTPEVNPHGADDESVDFLCPDILDPAMVTEQMDLEQNSVLRGAVNFRKANARALEKGLEDRTGYGASLIAHKAQVVADGITKFLADADTGKPGKRPVSAKHLKVIDPTIAGFLALQVVIVRRTCRPCRSARATTSGSPWSKPTRSPSGCPSRSY